ncbi:SixA phosphatase family protein [Pseudoalteromonas viridis]|uniref:Histidine phosphatase family protein n=1 Tax=Pseudoalteromonas viridis TaxID=339617 RepID=A0ABX7VC88_9GAMM|nr:phosphoglycerate mutase family protein [Pseudoalteromonas viridis]QTL37412.1 histidine phosphatase family protein [Pseudoalteromonas viridis]
MKILLLMLLTLASLTVHALPEQIVLIRHAEKMTGKDPELTPQGQQRAQRLATLLAPLNPKKLFSTDYHRTRQTLAPLSAATSVPVQMYNPKALADFAKQLKNDSGTIVVAGHSNTTPELIKLLSGHTVSIHEDEFDKVFIVSWKEGKAILEKRHSNEGKAQ